ncbi:MAG: HAD family phosphatase [Verrucomicrobiales bacterium]|nr:HAD family phosphatase [Verrucomicrobiales bacterium]
MNSNAIGALFDWDGVIIDSHNQHEKSWSKLAEEENEVLPDNFFKMTFGMRNENIIPNFFGNWIDVTNQEEVTRLADRKEEIYREIIISDGIEPLPGVRDLLQSLRSEEIACSIASSTPIANIETVMGMIGLSDYFDAITAAEDVSNGKPNPEVFLKAAEKIKVDPKNCVVFEDAHVGIEAGLAANMQVIAVATTHPVESLGNAHMVTENLEGIDAEKIMELFR